MNSKILIQVILVMLAILVFGIFYYQYFYKNQISKKKEIFDDENLKVSGNIIKDIEYKSSDNNGNTYIIKSKYGEFKDENKDIIFMTDVNAVMNFNNGTSVYLNSENANYNSLDNDTNFINDVELIYLDHKIIADNMDVFFKNSKLEAYNNLVYSNSDIDVLADKVQIDLITKDTKIFMFNNKKVKVINNN